MRSLPRFLQPLVLVVCTTAMSAVYLSAEAAEIDRGQALYENHCKLCHESWAHTREGRKVTSMADLRRRVRAWSIHSGLGWQREEIDEVVDYLNRKFYKLEETS